MRWIRLDACFDETWLFSLSAASQLAWVKLLCTVKRDGIGGRMKALSPVVAARKWGVGDEDVSKMLEAARKDGAIEIENGEWRIANWSKYQDTDTTSAERQKRFRQKSKSPIQVQNVTESNGVTTVTNRNACRVTETETETYITPPTPPLKSGGTRTAPKLVFSDELKTPSFRAAWDDWVSYRKARKLTVVEATLQGQLAKLAKFDDPVAVIRQSIENGWQGLFALKDPPNRQPVAAQPKAVRYHDGEQIR